MKSFLHLLFILMLPLLANAADYKGRVFLDRNFSGRFENSDSPLEGIVVTDGQNTVTTSIDGSFTLPGYEKTRFISITTPSGYQAVKYYIPVSSSVRSYDFPLTGNERTKRTNHSFVQITDTEIHNRGVSGKWAGYLKKYIANEEQAFLIHTGDICYENGLRNHIKVVNSETMGCPVYYCIGNHDLVKGEGDQGEQLFESIYGPTWYSFDAGNIHYVVTPMENGDYKPGYTKDEVYRWLKNDLAMMKPGQSLVIFNHNMLTTGNDFVFGTENGQVDLRKFNLKAWIYGHWHINYVRNQNGIYSVCTGTLDKGGIDHSASAFRVFKIEDNDIISMNLHYCPVDRQAVIVSPVDGQQAIVSSSGKIPLSVNAYYSGAGVKQVTYTTKCGGITGSVERMEQRSDWNWYAEIPAGTACAGKIVEVNVKTEFNDGKVMVSQSTFQYDPNFRPRIIAGDEWRNLLANPAHTGQPSSFLNAPLQLAWLTNVGSNIFMSSPLIVNNKVYVASADDSNKKTQGVYALDIQSGRLIWKYPTRNSVKNSIAMDSQTVFAQDAEGYLYAIDAATGKLKWEKLLSLESFPYLTEGLIADNGTVYAGTGTGLGAFHVKNGDPVWKNTSWKQHEGATTTLTLGDQVITAGTQWGALYGNDAVTGKMLWKAPEDGLSNRGASTTLHDGQFYVISRKSLFIIEPKTGAVTNRKELPEFDLDVTSTPLITKDEIIFGTADKGIVALDKQTLGIKWNTPTGQSLVYTAPYSTIPSATVETSPVLSNNIVFFGASDGCIYGLKAGTGEVVWKVRTGAPVLSSLAISGNTLIAADLSGNVYCFIP